MTPEQINREIAEKVMGWSGPISLGDDPRLFFDPANCIDHAWMVVEQLFVMNGNDYHCIHIEHLHKKWSVSCCYELGEWKDWIEADTAQMAICLAALEAVKEGWEEQLGDHYNPEVQPDVNNEWEKWAWDLAGTLSTSVEHRLHINQLLLTMPGVPKAATKTAV